MVHSLSREKEGEGLAGSHLRAARAARRSVGRHTPNKSAEVRNRPSVGRPFMSSRYFAGFDKERGGSRRDPGSPTLRPPTSLSRENAVCRQR